jgi:hypothetical protein
MDMAAHTHTLVLELPAGVNALYDCKPVLAELVGIAWFSVHTVSRKRCTTIAVVYTDNIA